MINFGESEEFEHLWAEGIQMHFMLYFKNDFK